MAPIFLVWGRWQVWQGDGGGSGAEGGELGFKGCGRGGGMGFEVRGGTGA